MAATNEELMGKFIRTGMIMRHIDGGGPRPGAHRRESQDERHERRPPAESGNEGRGPHGGGGCGRNHDRKGEQRRGQARVLTMISMKEGINQKDLAFLLGIRPQTLGELLQKLEERGLVERAKSETDGRAIEVTLTEAGRAHAAEIAERRALAAADIFAALSDDEKDQLNTILDKLGTELDKHNPRHHGKQ